ncbi:PAS domain-containing sensor histidine kinase [Calditrichota bacterium LG25]
MMINENTSLSEIDVIKNEEQLLTFIPKSVLGSLFKNFSITFFMLKPDKQYGYRFLYMGKSVERLLGFKSMDFVSDAGLWLRLIHDQDRPFLLKNGRRHLEHKYQKLTYRMKNCEGKYRWLRDELHPVFKDGKLDYFVGLWVDVSDEKSFEELSKENMTRFQTLIAASGQIIWSTDASGQVVEDVPGWRAFTGQSLEQVKGEGWLSSIHPEDLSNVQKAWNHALATKTDFKGEFRIRRHDGVYRWFIVRAVPVRNEGVGVHGWIGACADITEQVEREELLENYAARLEQSNRDLQEFAYIASHDLQEPARKILAFGDRLFAKYKNRLDEQGADYLKRMMNASKRMQNLINSLLTLSRVETRGKPFERIDLSRIVDEVISDLELNIKQVKGQINTEKLPSIEADETQIYQLFENLIRNALKFHRKDVTPRIKVYCSKKRSNNRRVTIVVEDNGIGIETQYADRIFKPFQRLHARDEYEGSGMGLAICRRIVERHHGKIYFESELNKGTKFFVELPVKQKKEKI